MAKDDDIMPAAERDMRHQSVLTKWERKQQANEARAEQTRKRAREALASELDKNRTALAQEIIQARNEGSDGLRRIKRILEDEGYSFEALKNNAGDE